MKILASDFDNTIYYLDDEEKNKKNAKAIQDFISQGNTFIIVSGRNYTDIKVLLDKNKISYTYLICEDGAKIFNSVDYCIFSPVQPENNQGSQKKIINVRLIINGATSFESDNNYVLKYW